MKTLILLFTVLIPGIGFAQPYSIDWYKVAGGGGSSSNNQYTLSGTIGQQDASSALTGGNYSLTGGFWGLIAVVQTPGAPLLSIKITGPNTVVVSWPLSFPGFTLQTNSNLSTTNWTAYGGIITSNSATISPPTGKQFFRLFKP